MADRGDPFASHVSPGDEHDTHHDTHSPGDRSPASSRGSADTNGSSGFVKLDAPDSSDGSGTASFDHYGSNLSGHIAQSEKPIDQYLSSLSDLKSDINAQYPHRPGAMEGSGDSYDFVPKYPTLDSDFGISKQMEHVDKTSNYSPYVRDESAQDAMQDLLGSPMTASANEYLGGFEPSHSPEPMTVSTTNEPDLLDDIAESPSEELQYANSPRYQTGAVDTGGAYGREFIEEEDDEENQPELGTPVRRRSPSPPAYSPQTRPSDPPPGPPVAASSYATKTKDLDIAHSKASACTFLHISQWNPQVLDVVYWRDPKKSGAILAGLLVVLLLFACCSVVSVLSYLGLLVLFGTLSFRLYKSVMGAIQKKEEANPFKPYLEKHVDIPQAKVHEQVDVMIGHATELVQHLRRLFLIEDFADSIKFGLVLWSLTFVGAWFSGVALLIIGVLAIFSVPKVYELYKEPIDQYYGIAHQKYTEIYNQVKEKVPFLKEKAQ